MALRHSVPLGFGEFRPKVELAMPPLMREPALVEFRKGANMVELVRQITDHVSVKVDAAVGAGKSTMMPKQLALHTKSLVFHVAANPLLVRSLHAYVSKCANNSTELYPPLELFSGYDQDVPRTGVYYIGAAAFVGLMLRPGGLSKYKDCIVFLDEAHESDAFTHVIRNLSLPCGAGSLVQASATFSAGGFRRMESDGKLKKCTYPADETPDKWNLEDLSKPWNYSAIRDSLVIFTDSRSYAKKLSVGYHELGIKTYCLTATMSDRDYDVAMAAMCDKKGELVVVLADSSFRSGVTWPTSRIIDTGRVQYYDPEPGKLVKKTRDAFAFELEQAAGRGGRIAGLATDYFRPDLDPKRVVCELEGVEAEGAAYLYRLLGYKPVRELSSCVMAYRDVPMEYKTDVVLRGLYPLTYYVMRDGKLMDGTQAKTVDSVEVAGSVGHQAVDSTAGSTGDSCSSSSSSTAASSVVCDVVGALHDVTARPFDTPELMDFTTVTTGDTISDDVIRAASFQRFEAGEPHATTAYEFSVRMGSGKEVCDRMITALGKRVMPDIEVGDLCELRYPVDPPKTSRLFPNGLASVLDFLDSGQLPVRMRGLSPADRAYVLHTLVVRYNSCAVEILAAGQALMSRAESVSKAAIYPGVRDYFVKVVERVSALDVEQTGLYGYIRDLCPAESVSDLHGADALVLERIYQYEKEFDRMLSSLARVGKGMLSELRKSLDVSVRELDIVSGANATVRFALCDLDDTRGRRAIGSGSARM